MIPRAELLAHHTTEAPRPVLVWRLASPILAISSASVGGGITTPGWVFNAQVPADYARTDLEAHVAEIAAELGYSGPGIGLLTAAAVDRRTETTDDGVGCVATVGVTLPIWAADTDDAGSPLVAGTINHVAYVPVRLTEAALVGAVVTAVEAKVQALLERDVPGTGTATDAVCILCPADGTPEPFAGPRSPWGARLARAVHATTLAGLS